MTTQLYELNLDQMKLQRLKLEEDLVSNCKDVKNKQIYSHIKDQLELFASVNEVIELLRDESMNHISHWEKLQNIIGDSKLNPYLLDFNFERILDLKLLQFRSAIEEQVSYARDQQKVDSGLDQIKLEWTKNELLYEYKNDNFKMLSNEKLAMSLEEHLTKIAEYKSKKFYEDFKEKIDTLEFELNKISDVFSLLRKVLEKWYYLKNVFSKDIDDISHQAGVEISNFQRNNLKFSKILKIFDILNELKIVRDCFLQRNLESDLKMIFIEFIGIEKDLFIFLVTKRNNFERFYFLSNDDFLELLGGAENSKIINFHLSKLFSGIDKVEIRIEKSKDPNKEFENRIDYIGDSFGERIKLKSHVLVLSIIETWMKVFEQMMFETLESNYSLYHNKVINEIRINKTEDFDQFLISKEIHGGQMLLTLTEYSWRKRMEVEFADIASFERENNKEKSEIDFERVIEPLKESLTLCVTYLEERKDFFIKKK